MAVLKLHKYAEYSGTEYYNVTVPHKFSGKFIDKKIMVSNSFHCPNCKKEITGDFLLYQETGGGISV